MFESLFYLPKMIYYFILLKKRSHWIVLLTFKRKFKFIVCRLEFIKKQIYPILMIFQILFTKGVSILFLLFIYFFKKESLQI